MLEKGRISSVQFYMVSVMVVLGTTILFIPGISVSIGGRDAWLAPILSGGIGLIVMMIMLQLNRYFPEQTPIEYFRLLFGKWAGSILSAYMLWVLLRFLAIMVREAVDFTTTAALNRTPPEMVMVIMLIVVWYIVRLGLEVITRFIQFVVIVELVQMVASVLFLASKDVDLSHLTPLFENGISPLLRSSLLISSWVSEVFIVGFLLPFIRVKHGVVKSSVWSIITLVVLLMITNIYTLGVFGDVIASRLQYGLYEVARYISIAEFLERVDPIVMGTWILLMVCKLAIFSYATSLGLAQLFRFSDYRPMVSFVCILIFTLSEQMFVNQADLTNFLSTVSPPFTFLMDVLFPLFVLCFATLRKKWGKSGV